MSYTIRRYAESDIEDVLEAWESASRIAHHFLDEDFLIQERKNIRQLYMPAAATWVVESDGKVVGFIALIGNEVGAIFLQPDYHGQGIGYALMNKAQELHGELELEVLKANAIGRAFYARYGFKQIAEKIHEPTGEPILRLRYVPQTDVSE